MKQSRQSLSKPPDGGWGWVVLGAAFFNAFITQGLLKSGGIILEAFPKVIPMTATEAAIIATISEAVMRLMAPVAGSMSQRFSYRSVVFFGGLTASLGLIASSFANNFAFVLATFGILFGIGSSFILVPCDIITGLYFDKYRAMAMGIEMAGGPLGAVFVAPCLNFLIEEYYLQGALLLYGGLLLHTCAGALVFRNGSWFSTPAAEESPKKITKAESTATMLTDLDSDIDPSNNSVYFIQTDYDFSPSKGNIIQDMSTSEEPSFVMDIEISDASLSKENSIQWKIQNAKTNVIPVFVKTNVSATGLCYNMNAKLSFFKEFRYWLVNISNLSMVMGFPMILTMLPQYARTEVDTSLTQNQATLLLMVFNLCDLIGRISFGLLADRNLFKRKHGFMATLLLAGVIAALFPLATTFQLLLAFTGVYGVIIGASSICPAVILNDAVGTVRFPVAYGTVITFSSLASFSSGPILGLVLQSTGSYKSCFYILTGVLAMGAIIWLLEPIHRHWSKKSYKFRKSPPTK